MDKTLPVLVVEDSKATGFIVREVLRRCGFTDIAIASDGSAALEQMRDRSFALVLADVDMRPMNGIVLLHHVRSDPKLRDTCFVLMSAYREAETVIVARASDVDSFLLKPFDARHLTEKLASLPRLHKIQCDGLSRPKPAALAIG